MLFLPSLKFDLHFLFSFFNSIFFRVYSILNHVHVCLCLFMDRCTYMQGVPPGAGVTGSCGILDMEAGN